MCSSDLRAMMLRYDPPQRTAYDDIEIAKEGDSNTIAQVSQTLNLVSSEELFDFLIKQADKLGASDIHIENERDSIRVRMRVDGALHPENVKHALDQNEAKKKESSSKLSNKEVEDFWVAAQKYCQENDIDFESFMGEMSRDTLLTLMEEGPDKIRERAPQFYEFVAQRFNGANAEATITSLLSAYSATGDANTAGRIGNIVGNVFSKAKPIIQGAGKALNGLFTFLDFKDQLDNGESLPNAAIKTAIHSWISGTVTTAVTTSVAGGIGGTIGAALGTFIPIPGAGTVIGYAIGVAAGVAVSWGVNKVADFLYDNTVGKAVNDVWNKGTEFVGNTVKSVGKSIGDGVSGFFSGLGTAFGF